MKSPRSLRSKVLLGIGGVLVLALYFTQFAVDERSWAVAALTCSWLLCFAAYLASRVQDTRAAPLARRDLTPPLVTVLDHRT